MKAKARVPDPRGEQPERLAANEAGCARISLRCASMRRSDVKPGRPGCDTAAAVPCLIGVYGYLGYPTAWMADRLGLDPTAHTAFVSGTGEIFSQTSHWEFVQSNIQ